MTDREHVSGEAGAGLRSFLDGAIREHRLTGFDAWLCSCTCGDQLEEGDYYSHLTDALLPLFERVHAEAHQRGREEGAREALLETADAWQINGWGNVLLPKPPTSANSVLAYANRITDWLRDRADATPPEGQ